jgi:hypothetical protein
LEPSGSPVPEVSRPTARADEVDPIAQFNTAGPGGGLLMRAIENPQMVQTIVDSIPDQGASLEELKKRKFYLEKYAHVRGDTSMTPYTGRNYGFLVNPHVMHEHALIPDDSNPLMPVDRKQPQIKRPVKFKFYPEDAQTGNSQKLIAGDYAHVKREGMSIPQHVPGKLDELIREQNKLKTQGRVGVGNWNEVEMLSAPPKAYVGMFHESSGAAFDTTFDLDRRKALIKSWADRTGQQALKVYRYEHLGKDGDRSALGMPGASKLSLHGEVLATGEFRLHGGATSTSSPLNTNTINPVVQPPVPTPINALQSTGGGVLQSSVGTEVVPKPAVADDKGKDPAPLHTIPIGSGGTKPSSPIFAPTLPNPRGRPLPVPPTAEKPAIVPTARKPTVLPSTTQPRPLPQPELQQQPLPATGSTGVKALFEMWKNREAQGANK